MAYVDDKNRAEAYASRIRLVIEVEVDADRFGDLHDDMTQRLESYATVEYLSISLAESHE